MQGSSCEEYRDKGVALVKAAIQADEEGNLEKALENYSKSFDWFFLYFKYEKNTAACNMVRAKARDYMTRAEQIKAELGNLKKAETISGGGSASEHKFKPTAAASISVTFEDIVGLDAAKQALTEAVILPRQLPVLFEDVKPWKGVLLYGPPGTGKTHLARALANEAQCSFFCISSADLTSKFVGESEQRVRALFESARQQKPSVIFIDEIDSLCSERKDSEADHSSRIKTEFLVQTEGVAVDNDQVLLMGATNLPWALDIGMRRRFEKRIYIPLPDCNARALIFKKQAPFLSALQLQKLAERTEHYSCADINIAIRDAKMQKVRKVQDATHFKPIGTKWMPCSPGDENAVEMDWKTLTNDQLVPPEMTFRDFVRGIEATKPSVAGTDLNRYEEWTREFGVE